MPESRPVGQSATSDHWTPKVGDQVWMNHPDGHLLGTVVRFVEADGPRKGQPVVREPDGDEDDLFVIHPMFLLPFEYGGPEWHKAVAEGRVG